MVSPQLSAYSRKEIHGFNGRDLLRLYIVLFSRYSKARIPGHLGRRKLKKSIGSQESILKSKYPASSIPDPPSVTFPARGAIPVEAFANIHRRPVEARKPTMAKSRRSVQFNHRGGNGRRASVSEISEGSSEPGSPIRNGSSAKAEVSKEEVHLSFSNEAADVSGGDFEISVGERVI